MRSIIKTLLVVFLLSFNKYAHCQENELENTSIAESLYNTKSCNLFVLLKNNNIIQDTLTILNVDSSDSELIKIEDNLWYFSYRIDEKCDDCIENHIVQMLFTSFKNKIHIALIIDFIYNYKPNYIDESSYYFNHKYIIEKDNIYENSMIHRSTLRVDCYPNDSIYKEEFNYSYPLFYDKRQHIFYTGEKKLNGLYVFSENGEEINLNDEVLKEINVGNREYVFLHNQWYRLMSYKNMRTVKREFNVVLSH